MKIYWDWDKVHGLRTGGPELIGKKFAVKLGEDQVIGKCFCGWMFIGTNDTLQENYTQHKNPSVES